MQRDEIAARLAGLSPAKRALLERRRRGEAPAAQVFTIGRRSGTGPAPLSFSQQRMWFLDRLEPGSPTYNLRVLLRLSGPLDVCALAASFQEVVRRHEVLRTAFREEDGVPVQVVLPRLDLEMPAIDVSGLPAPVRQEESLRRTRELAVRGFDLSRPPLIRVALVALGGTDHHLFVGMHHIVSDGWSMGVLVREVAALYAAFLVDAPLPLSGLPEPPIQYADFAVWQRGWLTGEVLERDLGYWRERLAGAATELDLPTDRPRPAVPTSGGAAWRFGFDAGLMAAVEALARRFQAAEEERERAVARASARIRTVPASRSGVSSTSTRSNGSGWHSGTRSAVRLAPAMPASRATPKASPLGPPASSSRPSVSGLMRTVAAATARRAVTGLAPTSTMRAAPWSSRWVGFSLTDPAPR